MPIPNKKSGESENDYIGRCMSAIGNEYPQDQALAICYGKFRENMSTEGKIANRINEFKKQYEGINLYPNGEVDMKAPCWNGYEQYGTKMVNGKEVPNCIPQK